MAGAGAHRCSSLRCVTIEPAEAQPQPQTLYEAVGGEPTFRKIAGRFYEQVAIDEVLSPLYPEEEREAAEERMRLFLIQRWGGPTTYTDMRGAPRLGMRHMPFRIGPKKRDAWLRAMRTAVDEAGLEEAHRDEIWAYFETVAWNLTTHADPSPRR